MRAPRPHPPPAPAPAPATTTTLLLTALLAACLALPGVSGAHWSYEGAHGPANWPGVCKEGKKQSPIDLGTSTIEESNFEELLTINYADAYNATITNNGHSIQINLQKPHFILLAAGGLNSVYNLEQIHFHWPSEHTINGVSYPLEAHFVHYDVKYKTLGNAVKVKGGIAVLGIMFHEIDSLQEDIKILNGVKDIKYNEIRKIQVVPKDLLPNSVKNFYRYHGSLTTPTCDETVVWTVLTDSRPLSKQQILNFRKVTDSTGQILSFNNRPLQKPNDRTVFINSANAITNSLIAFATSLIILKCI